MCDSRRTIGGENSAGKSEERIYSQTQAKKKVETRTFLWSSKFLGFDDEIWLPNRLQAISTCGSTSLWSFRARSEFVVLVFFGRRFLYLPFWVLVFIFTFFLFLASKWNGNMFCRPAAHGKQTTWPAGKLEGKTGQHGWLLKFSFSHVAKILRKVFKLLQRKCRKL